MLRLAVLAFSLLAAGRALACAITVTEVPQYLVRGADVIAEGVATGQPFEFRVGKVWKGSAPATIRLAPEERVSPGCGEPPRPTEPGTRYFLVLTHNPTRARVFRAGADDGLEQFLTGRTPVSRREVIARLRHWQEGKLPDTAFAQWLREMVPVADVNDWTDDGEGWEYSLALGVMRELRFRLFGSDVPLDELSCELGFLRERVAPAMIDVLGARRGDPQLEDVLDALLDDIEERCAPPIR